jgi:hypothetical protein
VREKERFQPGDAPWLARTTRATARGPAQPVLPSLTGSMSQHVQKVLEDGLLQNNSWRAPGVWGWERREGRKPGTQNWNVLDLVEGPGAAAHGRSSSRLGGPQGCGSCCVALTPPGGLVLRPLTHQAHGGHLGC